jgi:hypothetical protein
VASCSEGYSPLHSLKLEYCFSLVQSKLKGLLRLWNGLNFGRKRERRQKQTKIGKSRRHQQPTLAL